MTPPDLPTPIRVAVVDDHPIVRQGLAAVLDDLPDLDVVGSAGSAAEATALVRRLQPDVLLLDLEMPDTNGADALPGLLDAAPGLRVLIFTAYDEDERIFGAIRAGAKGYLLKGAPAGEIARAVRVVHGGGSYLEPRIAAKVLAGFGGAGRPAARGLSAREREVLRLVRDGLSNKQIAQALNVAERTVKFHLSSVFAKLDATSRAHAVALAIERGLL